MMVRPRRLADATPPPAESAVPADALVVELRA